MRADFELTQGETGTTFTFAVRDSRGVAYSIPGGSTITMRARRRTDGHVITSALVTFTGSSITWTSAAADSTHPGLYDVQFRVAAPSSKTFFVPTCAGEGSSPGLTLEVCEAV